MELTTVSKDSEPNIDRVDSETLDVFIAERYSTFLQLASVYCT